MIRSHIFITAVLTLILLLKIDSTNSQIIFTATNSQGLNVIINSSVYAINEGELVNINCRLQLGIGNGARWTYSNGTNVENYLNFTTRALSPVNSGQGLFFVLNQGFTVNNFRSLYTQSLGPSAMLTSFVIPPLATLLLAPSRTIEGNYTCLIGNLNETLQIRVNVPSGAFSRYYFRLNMNLLSAIGINDNNFQLAVMESILLRFIANASNPQEPARTFSCRSVPLIPSAQTVIDRYPNRIECSVSTYPPASTGEQQRELSIFSVQLTANQSAVLFDGSLTGFCDQNTTSSTEYGDYVWRETGSGIATLPCARRSTGNAIRRCLTNGSGWDNVDFSGCTDRTSCPNDTTTTDRGVFEWSTTLVGTTAMLSCPNGPNGAMATRTCTVNNWETPNISPCATTEIAEGFRSLSQVNVTVDNVESIFDNLTTLISLSVNTTSDQNSNNLQIITSLIQQTATLLSDTRVISTLSPTIFITTTEDVVEVLDAIEQWPSTVLSTQSNQIIRSFEVIINALVSLENFTNVTIISDDIAFRGERIQRSDFVGITFSASSSANTLSVSTESSSVNSTNELADSQLGTINLPQSIINITNNEDINLAFTVYTRSSLFPIRHSTVTSSAGTLVGSAIIGASVGGIPEGTMLLNDTITIVLLLNDIENATNPQCVFWDFDAAGGQGNWSTEGCTTMFSNDSDTVVCLCDHLTNFACLVDISARTVSSPTESPQVIALQIVTYVGAGLSLLGLILTIITLLIFKQLRQRDATKFHLQLCLALICLLVVFVSGIDKVSVREGCITVGVLIHYLTLVVWMWMGAEALLMLQKLVIVFSNITWRYLLIVSIICWTVPLIPVIITVAIDRDFYITLYSDGQSGFCFLRDLGPFLGGFLIPIFLIMVFNLIIFILVIRVLIRHTINKNKRMNKSAMSKSEAFKMLLSFSGIMILFGLTWVFAVLTFISEPGVSFAIQFVFAFFNAFQGFFIFIFFVILSSDSRDAWRSLLCSWTNKKEPSTAKSNLNSSKPNKCTNSTSGTNSSQDDTLQRIVPNRIDNEYDTTMPRDPNAFINNNVYDDDRLYQSNGHSNHKVKKDEIDDEQEMVLFPGARLTRQSTRRHTNVVQKVEVDFYHDFDNDDDESLYY